MQIDVGLRVLQNSYPLFEHSATSTNKSKAQLDRTKSYLEVVRAASVVDKLILPGLCVAELVKDKDVESLDCEEEVDEGEEGERLLSLTSMTITVVLRSKSQYCAISRVNEVKLGTYMTIRIARKKAKQSLRLWRAAAAETSAIPNCLTLKETGTHNEEYLK